MMSNSKNSMRSDYSVSSDDDEVKKDVSQGTINKYLPCVMGTLLSIYIRESEYLNSNSTLSTS